ncbi:MAG: hypothetical protein AAF497_24285, partial [Planctomycetota bacterium]
VSDFNIWNGNKFTSVAPLPAWNGFGIHNKAYTSSTSPVPRVSPFHGFDSSDDNADSLEARLDRIFAEDAGE